MSRSREQRVTAFFNARMRADDGWSDVTICNVSSRGLMAKRDASPAKGSYVEIWHQNVCIVGHVRWSQGGRFGIRSQNKIDISALVNSAPARPSLAGVERRSGSRALPKSKARPNVVANADANRTIARVFEWAAVAIGGAVVAGMLVTTASAALREPMQQVQSALRTGHEAPGIIRRPGVPAVPSLLDNHTAAPWFPIHLLPS
jgi:hypothetical protein